MSHSRLFRTLDHVLVILYMFICLCHWGAVFCNSLSLSFTKDRHAFSLRLTPHLLPFPTFPFCCTWFVVIIQNPRNLWTGSCHRLFTILTKQIRYKEDSHYLSSVISIIFIVSESTRQTIPVTNFVYRRRYSLPFFLFSFFDLFKHFWRWLPFLQPESLSNFTYVIYKRKIYS